MHAFDLERLAGRALVIRRARPGERIRTLDGVDRALEPDMLVIADAERASAVGGVMGGRDSEIGPHDAAHRARERLLPSAVGPPHEQAARAEDGGVDPLRARRRHRCARRSASRARRRCFDADRRRHATAGRSSIAIPRRGRSRKCGCERRASRGCSARPCRRGRRRADSGRARLRRREAAADADGGPSWAVTVPSFRVDVAREADLIEEVGRHYGFDRLPTTFPALDRAAGRRRRRRSRATGSSGRSCTAAGFSEAVTFAFIERDASAPFCEPGRGGGRRSPTRCRRSSPSSGRRCCRAWSTPCAHNRRRGAEGRAAVRGRQPLHARRRRTRGRRSSGAAPQTDRTGRRPSRRSTSSTPRASSRASARRVGVEAEFAPGRAELPGRGPRGRGARAATGRSGVVGQLAPAIAEARGFPAGEEVYVAELDLDALAIGERG